MNPIADGRQSPREKLPGLLLLPELRAEFVYGIIKFLWHQSLIKTLNLLLEFKNPEERNNKIPATVTVTVVYIFFHFLW